MNPALVVILVGLAATPAGADGRSALERDPRGWVDLMPGPGLSGWTRQPWKNQLRPEIAVWRVEKGVLVCRADQPAAVDAGKPGSHEWLRYEQPQGDFIWHVEWRFVDPAREGWNSGVVVRATADLKVFHQAQLGGEQSGYWFGDTPDASGTPARQKLTPREPRVKPPGQWNTYEITARGHQLTLWVNGAVTSEWQVRPPSGYIGLEAERHHVEFRNLKLKRLGAAPLKAR